PELAARPDALLDRVAPAPGDALARQVDDAVASRERLGGGRPAGWLPAQRGDRAERGPRPLWITGERGDVVAALEQPRDEARADQACGAGDRNAHEPRPRSS